MIQWQEIEKLYPFYKKYVGLKALCVTFLLFIPLVAWMRLPPAGIDPYLEIKLFFLCLFFVLGIKQILRLITKKEKPKDAE